MSSSNDHTADPTGSAGFGRTGHGHGARDTSAGVR